MDPSLEYGYTRDKGKRFKHDEYPEIFLYINFQMSEDFLRFMQLYLPIWEITRDDDFDEKYKVIIKRFSKYLKRNEEIIFLSGNVETDATVNLYISGKRVGIVNFVEDPYDEYSFVIESSNYGQIFYNFENQKLKSITVKNEKLKDKIESEFIPHLEDKYEDFDENKVKKEFKKFFKDIKFDPIFNLEINLQHSDVIEFEMETALETIHYEVNDQGYQIGETFFESEDEENVYSDKDLVVLKVQSVCDDLKTIVEVGEKKFNINVEKLIDRKVNGIFGFKRNKNDEDDYDSEDEENIFQRILNKFRNE